MLHDCATSQYCIGILAVAGRSLTPSSRRQPVHVESFNPLLHLFHYLHHSLLKRFVYVVIPTGLSIPFQRVSEGCHLFCLDKAKQSAPEGRLSFFVCADFIYEFLILSWSNINISGQSKNSYGAIFNDFAKQKNL